VANNVSLSVNGKVVAANVEANLLLVDFLRDNLGLTGTNIGCDTSQCGSCTLLLDGLPVKSCSLLVVQADGCEVITIEGLAGNAALHPMQQAFQDNHGLQCGFCTPGMVMAGIGMVERRRASGSGLPSDEEIRSALEGNICRCTGYHNIVKSIAQGAKDMLQGDADV
jgi:carbon-monoxide dehydrogenase small subunit